MRRVAAIKAPGDGLVGAPPRAADGGRFGAAVRHFFDRLGYPFYTLDAAWRFTFINAAAGTFWRRDRAGLLGKCIWDCFPQARGSEPCRLHHAALGEQRAIDVQSRSPVLGRPIRLMIKPDSAGLAVSFQPAGPKRLLLAEDTESVAELLADFLEESGWTVSTVACGTSARAALEHLIFDAAVLDDVLPGARGSELARHASLAAVPSVVMSGYPEVIDAQSGSSAFLRKPFRLEHLLHLLSSLAAERLT